MAKYLTHWLSPVQGDAYLDVDQMAAKVKAATPAGWAPRLLVPCLYGPWWQGDTDINNSLHADFRPKSAEDVKWIRERMYERGIAFGGWGVPRFCTYEEGQLHGMAAKAAGFYVLDLEPYEDFLLSPMDRTPGDFVVGYKSKCTTPYDLSIVPHDSGISPLGQQWLWWLLHCRRLHPQFYFTDAAQLDPVPATAFLKERMNAVRLSRPITMLLPCVPKGGDRTLELLANSTGNVDLWTLA